MNRIDRLTALMVYLQSTRWRTIEEVSERFDISKRTAFRDLKALQEGGIPILSEPGKGYTIMQGYHLPPVMLSKEEAASLLTGEKLVKKWGDSSLQQHYQTAMEKIRSVLRSREKDFVETLDHQMDFSHYLPAMNVLNQKSYFTTLQEAIFNREVIRIDYYSPLTEQSTTRSVEPLGLLHIGNYWQLAAWCRLREGYRAFRLDRMKAIYLTGKQFPEESGHSLQAFQQKKSDAHQPTHSVVRFTKTASRYITENKHFMRWVKEEEQDEFVDMTFETVFPGDYFARWLLSFSNQVEVISPDSLRQRVRELAQEVYEQHCTE
ncbi:YafY family protein [Rapidithrix thailandica]|uniref:YafY family protein n=1 Tax=Rapidithrix thailandica TaxID=413964 RepID=A0AAW9S525_9BACT